MHKGQRIAVVIPAFNEEKAIGKVLEALPEYVDDVIVVNDGSTDETLRVAQGFSCKIVSHDVRRGLGFVFRSGVSAALESGCDIAVTVDGDGQFDLSCIEDMLKPLVNGRADVVLGSRFLNGARPEGISWAKLSGNRLVSLIVSRIANKRFFDVSCGFRTYNRDSLLRLNTFGQFTYTHESLLALMFQGLRFVEVPVRARAEREKGRAKMSANLLVYGLRTLKIIFQTYRDFEPFKLFHRLGMIFLIPSLAAGGFTLGYFFLHGEFTPYKIIGLFAIIGFFVYLVCLMTGFLMEGVSRLRYNQEYLMFLMKSREAACPKNDGSA